MQTLSLSDEEVKMILDKREKEESEKPKFTGKLKCDLYINNCIGSNGYHSIAVPWLCSEEEKNEIVNEFENTFEKVLSVGAMFDCYIENNGTESWYDRENGIENMDKSWAREYLTDIKKVKKSKKS